MVYIDLDRIYPAGFDVKYYHIRTYAQFLTKQSVQWDEEKYLFDVSLYVAKTYEKNKNILKRGLTFDDDIRIIEHKKERESER